MNSKFLDTNLIIYLYSEDEPYKKDKILDLISTNEVIDQHR